jgi:hypothetical protein
MEPIAPILKKTAIASPYLASTKKSKMMKRDA